MRSASAGRAASSSARLATAAPSSSRGHDLAEQSPGLRLGRRDAPPAHDDVLRARGADHLDEPRGAAGAGDHPERQLGQRELRVVARHAEVAGQRELEADAEAVAVQLRDHRLRAALGRADVDVQVRERLGVALHEHADVAARREGLVARAAQHDDAHGVVVAELAEHAARARRARPC